MTFSINDLRDSGFDGFTGLLSLDTTKVADAGGVYVVIRPAETAAAFLTISRGGHFKGKDPTVPVATLIANWVPDCHTAYIGKATSLRSRLRQYRDYGQGKAVGHQGGRYIWQLADAADLQVCWKRSDDPRGTESAMLAAFVQQYGRRPFANLTD